MKKISCASSAGILALSLLLGACAGYAPAGVVAGQSEGDVARSMGARS